MIARRAVLNVSTHAPTRLMNHDDVHGARSNRPVACRNAGEEPTALLSAPPSEANTCTHGNKDSLGSDAEAVEAEHRWSGRCPRAHGDASCRRRELCGSHACVPGPLLCRVPSGRPADRCSCGLLWGISTGGRRVFPRYHGQSSHLI
jgi:hypothetical protein